MRTARRVVHHVVDCAEDPARSGCRVPDSQSGRFAREADAVAHDELRAASGAGAEGFAFMEVGDFGMFLVGEVVPAVADVGEFRVDEFFKDVAVEEDVAGGLDVEGLCVSGGMLVTGVWGMGLPVDVGVSRTRRDPGSHEMSGGGMLLRGSTMACGRIPWRTRPILRRWSSAG